MDQTYLWTKFENIKSPRWLYTNKNKIQKCHVNITSVAIVSDNKIKLITNNRVADQLDVVWLECICALVPRPLHGWTQDIETMLTYNWPIITEVGPTINQHWFSISCLLWLCDSDKVLRFRHETFCIRHQLKWDGQIKTKQAWAVCAARISINNQIL